MVVGFKDSSSDASSNTIRFGGYYLALLYSNTSDMIVYGLHMLGIVYGLHRLGIVYGLHRLEIIIYMTMYTCTMYIHVFK